MAINNQLILCSDSISQGDPIEFSLKLHSEKTFDSLQSITLYVSSNNRKIDVDDKFVLKKKPADDVTKATLKLAPTKDNVLDMMPVKFNRGTLLDITMTGSIPPGDYIINGEMWVTNSRFPIPGVPLKVKKLAPTGKPVTPTTSTPTQKASNP